MANGSYVEQSFERDTRYLGDRILPDDDRWPVEAGRYRLVVSRACPWASRLVITRRLLGLDGVISMGLCGPTHDADSWTFDLDPDGVDPVLGIPRIKDAYEKRQPGYPRGITVPAMVEVGSGQVVTNDFDPMELDLIVQWRDLQRAGAPDLYPEALRADLAPLMRRIYTEVNNGVYRCGFAGTQESYDDAFERLFTALDWLSDHLADRRYLMGDHLTVADIRLFTTLVRFDPVYHGHFKCNRSKLAELEVLWAYARDLFWTPGFGDTVDFAQIKRHYYVVHRDINPTGVVPDGPDLANWAAQDGRARLGGDPFGTGTPPGPPAPAERVDVAGNPFVGPDGLLVRP